MEILIISGLLIIYIYFYLLHFLPGKGGIFIPIGGFKKYNGLVSKEHSILYRISTGYFSAKLRKESKKKGVKLYYSTGLIKPLSILDFKKSAPPKTSKFSSSGHFLLITSSSAEPIAYSIDTFIGYSDAYEINTGVTFISIFVSLLLSLIFNSFLNVYFSLVPVILLAFYFRYETQLLN
ncbi:hypothetical protein DICPUDRAFT_80147 [Dictyostelium purpureum]|uniref:Uncharacterized protein n=1 Tax=Dictyostelium purpureum TaxID=5786 RepID=F0ZPN8_DICPU|nr:uncharacterized protein DICPUDRAFT_80147 [Dictyostelium purpureum]EGC34095.1 hypothetical protein DICPUDRAFT_80147 [Dictyostelium purpureum]|eukprot:XP_003289388.1 hypothetical protein DICPUDRAFT_80147 [Dictyostelium purpureum]